MEGPPNRRDAYGSEHILPSIPFQRLLSYHRHSTDLENHEEYGDGADEEIEGDDIILCDALPMHSCETATPYPMNEQWWS